MGRQQLVSARIAIPAGWFAVLVIFVLLTGILAAPYLGLGASIPAAAAASAVTEAAVAPLLSYQGRLTDPATGVPKADGTYVMSLRLYNVESGGAPLWSETKDVTVSKGLFNTLLGDTTALPKSPFTGQNLWLGIKVGSDTEAAPRLRLAPAAYALYADNADRLDDQDSTFFQNADNINAGTLADARVAGTLTRDGEVMGIVTANDGSGSGVDADTLDGYDSSAFFRGAAGVQLNSTLNAGASITWTSFGWSPNEMLIWWAAPRTLGGKLNVTVDTELEPCCGQGQGLIRYWITVRNTGTVNTSYDLIRYRFNQ